MDVFQISDVSTDESMSYTDNKGACQRRGHAPMFSGGPGKDDAVHGASFRPLRFQLRGRKRGKSSSMSVLAEASPPPHKLSLCSVRGPWQKTDGNVVILRCTFEGHICSTVAHKQGY